MSRSGSKKALPGTRALGDADLGRELSAHTVMFHQAMAERLGLSVTDYKCLDFLLRAERDGPMTAGDLARASGLTSGAITGVIDRLERAGFVLREANPDDRRQVRIRPRFERVSTYEPLFAPFAKAVGAALAEYDERDLAVISGFMRRMIEILKEQTARLREGADAAAAKPRDRRGRRRTA